MATRLQQLLGTIRKDSTWEHIWVKNLEREMLEGDVLREPYRKSDLVYICISTTSRAISQVPLRVMEPSAKHKDRLEPVDPAHPLQRLLIRPNFRMSQREFITALVGFLLLDGEVFVIPFPPRARVPNSLWAVRGSAMKEETSQESGQLIGWLYKPTDTLSIPLNVDEVCDITLWHPYDSNRGLSPLEAGRISIQADYQAGKYNQLFFKEGAVPGGVLSTEKSLTPIQYERLREEFEARHRDHRKVALLEGGLQYTQMGLSQKDMEFRDLRQFDGERIMQTFGMKKSIISVTSDLNHATADTERKQWWETTNLPLMGLVTDALTWCLLGPGSTTRIAFDTSSVAALHETFADKVKTGRSLFDMLFTPNEINQKLELGFDDKPWRDKAYAPVNLIAVEGGEAPGDEEKTEESETTLTPSAKEPKLLTSASSDEDARFDAVWRSLVAGASPIEAKCKSRVSRTFLDMRKRTLSMLLEGEKATRDISGVQQEEFEEEKEKLSGWVAGLFLLSLTLGMDTVQDYVGPEIPIPVTPDDPAAIAFLAEKQIQIRGVVDTVKEQVRAEIIAGLEAGESVEEIASRVRRKFDFAARRSLQIARTEVYGAINYGRWMSISASGFERQRWITAADERVRPTHVVMHGKKIKVNELWVVGGASLRFPGDPQGPAQETINCRCIVVPVP